MGGVGSDMASPGMGQRWGPRCSGLPGAGGAGWVGGGIRPMRAVGSARNALAAAGALLGVGQGLHEGGQAAADFGPGGGQVDRVGPSGDHVGDAACGVVVVQVGQVAGRQDQRARRCRDAARVLADQLGRGDEDALEAATDAVGDEPFLGHDRDAVGAFADGHDGGRHGSGGDVAHEFLGQFAGLGGSGGRCGHDGLHVGRLVSGARCGRAAAGTLHKGGWWRSRPPGWRACVVAGLSPRRRGLRRRPRRGRGGRGRGR